MKYTQQQLQDLADQGRLRELDEICALAQGWAKFKLVWLGSGYSIKDYSPTTNKSQAMELIIKFKLYFSSDEEDRLIFVASGKPHMNDAIVENKDPLIAIVIAAILV